MASFDVFNGDADGLCGMVQLRLAAPKKTRVITGVKRDIRLLKNVTVAPESDITVVDISMHANRTELEGALSKGATVEWFDHHYPGDIPRHPKLAAHIDTDPNMCSSLVIDQYLRGRYRNWAITAAFGDNLTETATELAKEKKLSAQQMDELRELGVYINYNGYGETVDDLWIKPSTLFEMLLSFDDPINLIAETNLLSQLRNGYNEGLKYARDVRLDSSDNLVTLCVLPDKKWARRIVGAYANELATRSPERAHAILVEQPTGYVVSIRAPRDNPLNAHRVALEFDTGGGRESAAGIQSLPSESVPRLIESMRRHFG